MRSFENIWKGSSESILSSEWFMSVYDPKASETSETILYTAETALSCLRLGRGTAATSSTPLSVIFTIGCKTHCCRPKVSTFMRQAQGREGAQASLEPGPASHYSSSLCIGEARGRGREWAARESWSHSGRRGSTGDLFSSLSGSPLSVWTDIIMA